jgi:hypothetical protein
MLWQTIANVRPPHKTIKRCGMDADLIVVVVGLFGREMLYKMGKRFVRCGGLPYTLLRPWSRCEGVGLHRDRVRHHFVAVER